MSKLVLRGMTWDHRRALDPLLATLPEFRRRYPDVDVDWSSRPLQGFEFASVEALARDYDLIVFDHPFGGEIAETRCLHPLNDIVDAGLGSAFVGPSLESYRYGDHVWALPIDAACQVAVARPDLLARLDRAAPFLWHEMMELGQRACRGGLKLAIGLKGVHSLMTFFTLCANLGKPCAIEAERDFVDPETARTVLDEMRRLLSLCPPEVLDWNSIALHDAMVGRDDLVYCPLVYCYATYAEVDMRRPLKFFNLPGLRAQDPRGSTIGGAGIGVSATRAGQGSALAYVRYLAETATQKAFAASHGQPARIDSWEDPAIDSRFAGCFSATRSTIEAAWIRPRYLGYLRFQEKGGMLVERHLRGEITEHDLLSRLSVLHSSKGAG
jgi:multiple sugar transport system substrate-binding protein